MLKVNALTSATSGRSGTADLSGVDFSSIKSTGHSIAAVFPVNDIATTQDAIDMILPTGIPEYASAFEDKISFDDPVASLNYLAGEAYPKLNSYVKENDAETWQRYLNLATKPVGISCEFCCGIGPVGISPDGRSRCGCQHNPAVLAITLGLMEYTDMSDAEVLREVMRWKTLFFPKDMLNLAMTVAGKDASEISNLPGMVGGC